MGQWTVMGGAVLHQCLRWWLKKSGRYIYMCVKTSKPILVQMCRSSTFSFPPSPHVCVYVCVECSYTFVGPVVRLVVRSLDTVTGRRRKNGYKSDNG